MASSPKIEIVANGFGQPGDIDVVEARVRDPGVGEVTVDVRAAGINPRDIKAYADPTYAVQRGQRETRFPMHLGVEASGVVVAIGPQADGPAGPIEVGDAVIAYRISGAYAETVTVPAQQVVPKPSNLSWEQAGAMMLTGTTAIHALATVRARRGQALLIHAAAGGVGLAAVQLARLDGIRVIGTAGHHDFEKLRRHGVEPVIYGPGLLDRVRKLAPDGIDAALDFVGTDEAVDTSLDVVSDRSRIATIVAVERARRDGFAFLGGAAGQAPAGLAIRDAARLRLTALAQAGAYDVPVARAFPLAGAAEAHRLLAREGFKGRNVLVPGTSREEMRTQVGV